MALHALTLITFLAASASPTPLYRLYQETWGFSSLWLTAVFAVYAAGLLLALLSFGALSDRIGRKPVILAALAFQTLAVTLFLLADDIVWLLAARIVQGFATGLATTAVGAALLDLDRDRGALINSVVPMIGMGIGALSSTLLAEFAPYPLRLGFAVLLALFLVQTARSARAPDTSTSRDPGAWSWRPRVGVPAAARAPLWRVTPINMALWALGGMYMALMPSLLRDIAGPQAAWLGGIAAALLTFTGAIGVLLMRQRSPHLALRVGALSLVAGTVTFLTGVWLRDLVILMIAPIIAGVGFGATFLGTLRTIVPFAQPHERAGLMAAFYVQSYLTNAVPILLAGYAAGRFGLPLTATAFAGAILTLAIVGLVTTWRLARQNVACGS